MSEAEISFLIGDIYDAALEPARWPQVLERLCGFVGGTQAQIFWQDVVGKSAGKFFEWGNDPHYTQLYMEVYAKANPLFPAAYHFPVGQVFCQSDVMPYEELYETRLYKEWMQPQDYVDFIACHLEKSGSSCVPVTVIRHARDGRVDDKAFARMKLLVPHIRRAALIGNVIGLKSCELATLADMLDGLSAGIFLADAAGRIVHANVSGRAMLAAGMVLRSAGGRLAANEPDADRMLKDVFAAAGDGDAAVGTQCVALSLQAPGGTHYVAHVLPLTAGERRRAGVAYESVAAVFVHEVALDEPHAATNALAKAYRLTAMELRVLLGIIEVGGGSAVAQELGISKATVRTHLRHIFEKTGSNRQADLARLVAAFESPLTRSVAARPRN
jgi:DNA-binding CsgD family transcriptional regulator